MIRADVKPALMAAIEGEFAKCPRDPAFVPTRVSRPDQVKRAAAAAAAASSSGGPAANGGWAESGGSGSDLVVLCTNPSRTV